MRRTKGIPAARFAEDVTRYTLPFHLKKNGQPINWPSDVPVNQRIARAQLSVVNEPCNPFRGTSRFTASYTSKARVMDSSYVAWRRNGHLF